jgi:hypothetical protein
MQTHTKNIKVSYFNLFSHQTIHYNLKLATLTLGKNRIPLKEVKNTYLYCSDDNTPIYYITHNTQAIEENNGKGFESNNNQSFKDQTEEEKLTDRKAGRSDIIPDEIKAEPFFEKVKELPSEETEVKIDLIYQKRITILTMISLKLC